MWEKKTPMISLSLNFTEFIRDKISVHCFMLHIKFFFLFVKFMKNHMPLLKLKMHWAVAEKSNKKVKEQKPKQDESLWTHGREKHANVVLGGQGDTFWVTQCKGMDHLYQGTHCYINVGQAWNRREVNCIYSQNGMNLSTFKRLFPETDPKATFKPEGLGWNLLKSHSIQMFKDHQILVEG